VSAARRQQQLCTPRRSREALDHELHETVVQKNPIAELHHARQLLEGRRGALRIANDVLTR